MLFINVALSEELIHFVFVDDTIAIDIELFELSAQSELLSISLFLGRHGASIP